MNDFSHKIYDVDHLDDMTSQIKDLSTHTDYDHKKHQLIFELKDGQILKLRLPLQAIYQDDSIGILEERSFIILIVESGHAALAYGEGEHIIEHKVFKSYMVRKKQGKSQLKHLKQKGKSKAGSRVRLANTLHFFEEIREKVTEWFEYFDIDTIYFSCSKSLYPHLFTEDFELDRKDERLHKIPKHIPEANFENLLETHQYLLKAELIGEERLVKKVISGS